MSHCCIKLNVLLSSSILSIHYQLSDEPHLDGQDQDAAGEKVGTLISPAPRVAGFLATACSVVFKGTMTVIYKAQPVILLRVGAGSTCSLAGPVNHNSEHLHTHCSKVDTQRPPDNTGREQRHSKYRNATLFYLAISDCFCNQLILIVRSVLKPTG